MKHDVKYISNDLQDRHVADVQMIHELNNINNPTPRERLERGIVNAIMKMKLVLGQGILKDNDPLANELHHPYRKPNKFLKVQVHYKDHTHASDIVVMPNKSITTKIYLCPSLDLLGITTISLAWVWSLY